MFMRGKYFNIIGIFFAVFQAGCGFTPPRLEEPWEVVEVPRNLEYRIKNHLFCELVRALWYVKGNVKANGKPAIPDDYGVQMQVSLTVEESSALNPGVTLNKTLANAISSGVEVDQMRNLGFGGNLSSTSTRTDTLYSYYNVGRISGPGKNLFCADPQDQHGSSLLLQSDLGIKKFLAGAALQERIFGSSPKPAFDDEAKLNVYSYDIKFVVITNGSITPSWKLVDISANTDGSSFFAVGRNRTHQLILTFGPGEREPTPASLQTHFTPQIVQALTRR